MNLTIGQSVKIKSITKEGVREQKYIPPMDTIYTISAISENSITLKSEKWINTFKKGQLTLQICEKS